MIFERRLPAIIMGRNTNGDGHSWVADGWLYRTRIVYSIYNDGSKKKYMTQGQRLVHCNFGWGGTANGYYYYGAFDLRNGPEAGYDGEDTSSSSDKYYDMELIVTYTNCP